MADHITSPIPPSQTYFGTLAKPFLPLNLPEVFLPLLHPKHGLTNYKLTWRRAVGGLYPVLQPAGDVPVLEDPVSDLIHRLMTGDDHESRLEAAAALHATRVSPPPVSEDEELKPCPFCGGEAERAVNTLLGGMSMAQCRQCGASAYDRKWNRRSLIISATDDVPPPETKHARDCAYVVSDGPAACTCPAGLLAAAPKLPTPSDEGRPSRYEAREDLVLDSFGGGHSFRVVPVMGQLEEEARQIATLVVASLNAPSSDEAWLREDKK